MRTLGISWGLGWFTLGGVRYGYGVVFVNVTCCRSEGEIYKMSLIIPEKFQHIHRVMNTNIDGNRKVPFALTAIKVHSD